MSESFSQYRDMCVEEISSLQDEFKKVYDLNNYERWSFDEDFGVFHFESDDGRALYFKYSLVGSFSEKTSTWKWSWDNEHLKASERRRVDEVKTFGEQNDFTSLTTGLIGADEYTGWEMTSICAKILSAIGVYRFTQEHLTFYVIFTNELTKEQYDSWRKHAVTCESHGTSRAAFVCQHLNKDVFTGFHEAFESNPLIEPDDDYQAWCDECEKIREQEGEWNDVSEGFAKIRLICDQCFFEVKQRNQTN
jgi:hypothetical protein